MGESMGSRTWTELTRARASEQARRFGELQLGLVVHAGDGGTFECHVEAQVEPGTWSLWRLETELAAAVLAVREGSEPMSWEEAGTLCIDTAVGAFISGEAAEELDATDSEDFAMEVIDEALFGQSRDEAVVKTPGGNALAVFRLGGDGEYAVARGLDAEGAVCALVVLAWDEAVASVG